MEMVYSKDRKTRWDVLSAWLSRVLTQLAFTTCYPGGALPSTAKEICPHFSILFRSAFSAAAWPSGPASRRVAIHLVTSCQNAYSNEATFGISDGILGYFPKILQIVLRQGVNRGDENLS
jgi:hypothetical protein